MKNVKKMLFLSLLTVLLLACGEKSQQQDAGTTGSESATAVANRTIEIRTGNKIIAELELQGEETKISVENTTLYARARKGEKRKYEEGNSVVAEIKYSDDGFKLRNNDGQLLWKVKIYDDKIKISNNEDGENAFQVKESNSDKIKVKLNDVEVGAARSKQRDVHISTEDGSIEFEVKNAELQKGYAVLAIREIPMRDRLIILGELLK